MTNKLLVVIINGLKVPKIKKILLYEMKFSCTKLQLPPEPLTRGYVPRSPFSLSSVLNWLFWTPPPRKKNPSYATASWCSEADFEGVKCTATRRNDVISNMISESLHFRHTLCTSVCMILTKMITSLDSVHYADTKADAMCLLRRTCRIHTCHLTQGQAS